MKFIHSFIGQIAENTIKNALRIEIANTAGKKLTGYVVETLSRTNCIYALVANLKFERDRSRTGPVALAVTFHDACLLSFS
jgi:hypothetical protein